jgi:O-antigen/teichoic acid export membrane protein
VLTAFLQFLISIPIILKNINIYKFNIPLVKKMFLFGIPFFPAAILFIITGMIDRFFINHYLGMAQVGIYGAGYKIGSIISISIIAFNLNWQPYYLKHHEDKMFSKNIKKISQLFSVFLLLIVTFISIGWQLIIKVQLFNYSLIGSEFWGSGIIIPWIAFGYYFYGLFVLQMPTIYLKNKQLWVPFFWAVAAIINIILNILLIPGLGLMGAGIATLSSYLIMFIYLYIKNQRWMPLNFINKFLIFYFILSLIVVCLVNCYALSNTIQLIAFIIYSAIGLNYLLSYKKFLL